ncbi:MAG: hypothetical protein ACNA8W_20840 [Bradymonadaceae bacterium]
MGTVRITYLFHENGTGQYDQIVGLPGADGSNPFHWELQGRNLVLQMEKGGKTVTYRVDHWADQKMIWYNYFRSENFYLARTK